MSVKIKYTEELLKQMCIDNDLEFIGIFYKNHSNKKRRMIDFCCNKHKNKGVQTLVVEKFVANKKKCSYCNHNKLKETFVDEIEDINPNIKILSEYKNWNTKVKCKCKIDGNIWKTVPSVLLSGGGCPICGRKKANITESNSLDDIKNRLQIVNDNIEIIGEYNGYHKMIQCHCKVCDCKWKSIVANLLNGSACCPDCTKIRMNQKFSFSQEEFVRKAKDINPNIEIIGKYVNTKTDIQCYCSEHNQYYVTKPYVILYKGGSGCPYCIQSKGERKMLQLLSDYGFKVESQYTFPDCKNIIRLRFDAYDIINNIAYEYQGGQHYFSVDFGGEGKEQAEKNFKKLQKCDNIKKEYCKNNNIRLIEIPYWEEDNMENFLIKKWNELNIV